MVLSPEDIQAIQAHKPDAPAKRGFDGEGESEQKKKKPKSKAQLDDEITRGLLAERNDPKGPVSGVFFEDI